MGWILIMGMALTGMGILVGLYLPILVTHYATPEKIRIYVIVGAVLVVAGTALQIFSVSPLLESETEQMSGD